MKAVGIRELKARLSEYLRLVKAGETILVTDRREVIAELRPPGRRPRDGDGLDRTLERLADEGEVTRAAVSKGRWTWRACGLGLPPGTAAALLDELRGEHS